MKYSGYPEEGNITMETLEVLESMLKQLEEKIEEAKLQLPAHSTKPPVMMALLDLEDEREVILSQISSIKKTKGSPIKGRVK